MTRKGDGADPKGLIADAYRIEGIGDAECRSVFLDWALSLPQDADMRVHLGVLLERHGIEGHPMTAILREGQARALAPRRRGGASGRRN